MLMEVFPAPLLDGDPYKGRILHAWEKDKTPKADAQAIVYVLSGGKYYKYVKV